MLVSLLIIMIVLLLLKIWADKRTIKNITQQLNQISYYDRTNQQLRLSGHNRQLKSLIMTVNLMIQKHKKLEHHHQLELMKKKKEITNISHDLRTPLTSIKGFTELLQDERLPLGKRIMYQEFVSRKLSTLEELIDLFYQTSQLDTDQMELHYEYISLEELFGDCLLPYYNDFEKKSIRLSIDEENLNHKIWVDRITTKRLFTNIIDNALRYALSEFRITVSDQVGELTLSIENDVREPISEDDLKKIFDRSYTIDQSRSNGQTGLGLYIAKQLMVKQRGSMTAQYDNERQVIRLMLTFRKGKGLVNSQAGKTGD